ncbi:MAG: SLC13 family permease [Planctomycetota bacterium]|nr:SLC13 family permease [Planctomycetota bacterium]
MDPTWITISILLTGIVVVIGGVLVLRLHAFLALVLGALVVSVLTPANDIEQHAIETSGFRVRDSSIDIDGLAADQIVLELKKGQSAAVGTTCVVLAPAADGRGYAQVDGVSLKVVKLTKSKTGKRVAIAEVVSGNRPATNSIAISPADRAAANNLAHKQSIANRVADGFGSTCTKIGILIAMASIVGKCLLDSGAADRIVRSTLTVLGEKRAPISFMTSGFLLGIPVFFDTVFYLMIPLGKAMRARTGRNYLLYVLTIVCGATMAHSLVPPTPGPLFVAEQLGVDLGVMILGGCIVGFFTVVFGCFYAQLANKIWELPLRESPDLSLAELEAISKREDSELPPLWLSLAPIVLPVVFIGGFTVLNRIVDDKGSAFMRIAATLGDKNIALTISAVIAMGMLVWKKRTSLKDLAEATQSSLSSGGVIILITAAGGAFGRVLQQTGVSGLIGELSSTSPVMIVSLAFMITAAVRTAQGSATVAMITAVGILSGLASELTFHPVYLALAIGCGSKPIGWMNDSGFWVITKMSGMTEAEGLKYVTPMTSLMGVVGLIAVIVGVSVFPMSPV